MPEYIGRNAYLIFGSTVLSTRYTTVDTDESVALVDKSAGSDTHDSFLAALASGSLSVGFNHNAGDTATWNAVAPGTEGTLIYAPEGTATTKPKHTVVCIVENRQSKIAYNDLRRMTVSFKTQEAVTQSVY